MACRRAWTTDELAYLRRWAGRKGIELMHDELGRTKHAIEVQMSRMGLSWRCHECGLVWCQQCCAWRTKLVDGMCPVCTRKATRDRQMEQERVLVGMLDAEQRAALRPGMHRSRIDPRPRSRSPEIENVFEKQVADEEAARAMESWEVRNLNRENAARRRRIERLREIV